MNSFLGFFLCCIVCSPFGRFGRKAASRPRVVYRRRVATVKNSRSNSFVSTSRHCLCSFPNFSKPLRRSHSTVAPVQVMLQLWRFSALGILLALVSAVLGEDTAQKVLSENAKVSNDSLLWGPYRPNLYFGVRPRIPKSLMTGLIWAKVDSFQGVQNSMWL